MITIFNDNDNNALTIYIVKYQTLLLAGKRAEKKSMDKKDDRTNFNHMYINLGNILLIYYF